jgi:hypothetical protein
VILDTCLLSSDSTSPTSYMHSSDHLPSEKPISCPTAVLLLFSNVWNLVQLQQVLLCSFSFLVGTSLSFTKIHHSCHSYSIPATYVGASFPLTFGIHLVINGRATSVGSQVEDILNGLLKLFDILLDSEYSLTSTVNEWIMIRYSGLVLVSMMLAHHLHLLRFFSRLVLSSNGRFV